jgi:hypothetical protein
MDERTMRSLNLAFRFVLELTVLVALFMAGMSLSSDLLIGTALGLGLALVAIAIWGLFVAPKASRRLEDPTRVVVELGVFGAGAIAFVVSGNLVLALLLAAAAIISVMLMFLWGQRGY